MFFFFCSCLLVFLWVFSFLAFSHFLRFSLFQVVIFPFQLEVVGVQASIFLVFQTQLLQCLRVSCFVSGPFLGMGPVFRRKHYKNRGFKVFWHP